MATDLIKPHVQVPYQNITGLQALQRSVIQAMKTVLEVEKNHQYVAKERSGRKRRFYCIELLIGKPGYKVKYEKEC